MERFDHDRAVRRLEHANLVETARDQRRRHEPREIEHEDLLGRVAHRTRIVDHQRLARDPFEQPGAGEVADVERGVLAHQHHVDIAAEVDPARLAQREVIADDSADLDRRGPGGDPAVEPGQVVDMIMPDLMPAHLRGEHQREAGISVDVNPGERVHLHGNTDGHVVEITLSAARH